jgi:ribonuclease J
MATTITCYGGINEIGGNKILLKDDHTCLAFDFGTSFGRRYLFYEEYLTPRPGAGLLDLLRMELLPPLEGIYRQDLVPTDDLWPSLRDSPLHKELTLDGVILSHAHIDHSGYISFLNTDIPIYATAMTAFIAKAMQDSGPSDFEREVCYSNPRQLQDGVLRAGECYRQRPFAFVGGCPTSEEAEAFWSYSPAKTKPLELYAETVPSDKVSGLSLQYFPVDHSIFGAAAFAVETGQGWIGYTGDLRLHGNRAHETWRFVEEVSKLQPVALICEGTHVDSAEHVSEEEVFINALKEVREAEGLVVADFSLRNVDRLITFHRIAQETGRKLVVPAKGAYLLEAMRLVSNDIPDIGAIGDILIYEDLKATLSCWEEQLRQRYGHRTIGPSHVRVNQGELILCFSFWDMKHLIDINPERGVYIYSSSEAHSEEQQIDLMRLRNWLDHFGMRFVGDPEGGEGGLHASGHASGPDLLKVIHRIKPRVLIPIHTLNPGYFVAHLQGQGIEVYMPKLGEEIPIVS